MANLRFLVVTVFVLVVTAVLAGKHHGRWKRSPGFVDFLWKTAKKELAAVKQPITTALVNIGSKQCENVKKLIGVVYDEMTDAAEPDLNQLSLEYRDKSTRIIYKMSTAAEEIPSAYHHDLQEKLIIFVHGFTDGPGKSSYGNVSEALLAMGDLNVLALDGSSLIDWLYLRATTYVRFIGDLLGRVLATMANKGEVNPANIHIIGHSLGAHISGFTGKTFTNLTGHRIGRISGLDPAGPCFSHLGSDLRLKDSDAEFVDVIHTDGGVYGMKDPVGHADFYPNSGSGQPNCFSQSCGHRRAWRYFTESVLSLDAFPARKCADWDAFKKNNCDQEIRHMGYGCETDARGVYFLQTSGDPPFALRDQGLIYKNKEGIVKNVLNLF